jgi:hypothetical protein
LINTYQTYLSKDAKRGEGVVRMRIVEAPVAIPAKSINKGT